MGDGRGRWTFAFGGGKSLLGSAARRLGRSRCARSRAGACGALACSYRATKTIRRGSLAPLRSRKRLRTWVGAMAATCGWTFVGAALTSIGCKRLHQELVSLQPDIMYPRGSGNGERPEENSERVGLS